MKTIVRHGTYIDIMRMVKKMSNKRHAKHVHSIDVHELQNDKATLKLVFYTTRELTATHS